MIFLNYKMSLRVARANAVREKATRQSRGDNSLAWHGIAALRSFACWRIHSARNDGKGHDGTMNN